jgi:hypothetical protein
LDNTEYGRDLYSEAVLAREKFFENWKNGRFFVKGLIVWLAGLSTFRTIFSIVETGDAKAVFSSTVNLIIVSLVMWFLYRGRKWAYYITIILLLSAPAKMLVNYLGESAVPSTTSIIHTILLLLAAVMMISWKPIRIYLDLQNRNKVPAELPFPLYYDFSNPQYRLLPSHLKEINSCKFNETECDNLIDNIVMELGDKRSKDCIFTQLVTGDGDKVFLRIDDRESILLSFSSLYKAKCYAIVTGLADKVSYIRYTAEEFKNDCEKNISDFNRVILDYCPHCFTGNIVTIESLETDDFIKIWAMNKAFKQLLYRDYLSAAQQEFLAGNYILAHNIAMETVEHIDAERPEVHMLIGKCSIKLDKPFILRQAYSYLSIFGENHASELYDLANKSTFDADAH